ncbi:MAG: hypothetical protein R3B70_07435 [Polyangiaceae bacterium]
MDHRVQLVLLGAHTRVVATLCASCPSGASGCCAAPPGLSWADIGRIASLGGAAFVVSEMRAGRLRRGPRGLIIHRVDDGAGSAKCVYHAAGEGCTIPADRRSAACNYYVCADALLVSGPERVSAEAACAAWTTQYAAWDEILSAEVSGWAGRPDTPEDDLRLFEQLGARFLSLSSASARPQK